MPLLTSSIGLLIVLLYIPGGFTQIGYSLRGAILRWLEKRLPERPTKTVDRAAGVAHARRDAAARSSTNADGSVLATHGLTRATSAASSRSTASTSAPSRAR